MSVFQYGPFTPGTPLVSLDAKRAELNDLFDMVVTNQLNDDNLLRSLFRRLPQMGNPYGFRVRVGRNATAGMRAEPTTSAALVDADYGQQSRLRVAEEAAVLYIGMAVTDYMLASSAGDGGIDVMLEEMSDAVADFKELEEEQFFAVRAASGSISGESVNSMVGIPHVLQETDPTPTETDTLYGTSRTANTILYGQASYGSPAGTQRALTQALIDTELRNTHEAGGRVNVFVTKRAQHDTWNNLFSTNQRFMNETEIDAGFVLSTYRGIPIITSVNCCTRDGATLVNDANGSGDIFGLDMRHWEMRVLKEAQVTPISKDGPTSKRYIEAYQQLICKKPNSSFAIYDLL